MGHSALRLAGASLAVFHGRLLWQRWNDGSLADLGVLGQWLASGLLLAGLIVIHRQCGSVFRGRRAVALWALVAVLHALAGVPATQLLSAPVPWLVVPLGLAVVGGLLYGLAWRRGRSPLAILGGGSWSLRSSAVRAGFGGCRSARGPPC